MYACRPISSTARSLASLLCLFALLLSACSNPTPAPPANTPTSAATLTPPVTPAQPPALTSTPTAVSATAAAPTRSTTATATTAPSPTPEPSPTPAPWEALSLAGTPLPGSGETISLDNLEQVRALSRWGSGAASGVYFASTSGWLGIQTSLGDYAYQPPDFVPIQPSAAEWAQAKRSAGPLYELDFSRCTRTPCPDADLLRDGEKILELQASGDFAVAPNGFLAAAELFSGGLQQLWLYDLYAGQPPRQLDTQAKDASDATATCFHEISGLAFSPEADLLAAACQGGGIYVYRTEDGALIHSLGPAAQANAMQPTWMWFSPQGDRLASYQAGVLFMWELDAPMQPEPLFSIPAPGAVDQMKAISRDGRWLAVAQHTGPVQVFDLNDGSLAHSLLEPAPQEDILCISPQGELVANHVTSAGEQPAIQLRRLADGVVLNTLPVPGSQNTYLYQCEFASGGELLLVSTSDGVYTWSLPGGEAEAASPSGRIPARSYQVAIHPDGETLVALQESGLQSYTLPGLKSSAALRGPANALAFALSPNGEQIVIGAEGLFQVRSFPQGKRLLDVDLPGRQVESLLFTPGGSRLLVSLYDPAQDRHDYQLYDAENWEMLLQAPESIELGSVQTFSPDGAILATRNEAEIVLRRAADLRGLVSLPGHSDFVYRLAFSPDGSLLLSTALDGSIRVWGIP